MVGNAFEKATDFSRIDPEKIVNPDKIKFDDSYKEITINSILDYVWSEFEKITVVHVGDKGDYGSYRREKLLESINNGNRESVVHRFESLSDKKKQRLRRDMISLARKKKIKNETRKMFKSYIKLLFKEDVLSPYSSMGSVDR